VAGKLRTGDTLPGDRVLAAQARRSRSSVRAGIQILVSQGYLVVRERRRVLVRKPPGRRVLDGRRFALEWERVRAGSFDPELTAFCVDHGVAWSDYQVEIVAWEVVPATKTQALLLSVPPGTPVLRRHLVELARNVPVQVRRSVIPHSLVRGTAIERPESQPYPGGTIAEIYHLGYEVTDVNEDISSRPAAADEVTALLLTDGMHVLEDVRTFIAVDGGRSRPIEVSELILPARGNSLRLTTHL
jgi:GntR family transcriptional regulator